MRLVFAGTPPFAATILESLVEAGHPVSLVLTQPDRAKGRGLKTTPSAVSTLATRLGLPQEKPASLKDPLLIAALRAADPDVMVVAAYGLLLPPPVLALPRLGCLNVHGSLLPRWRGAAPVQRAILSGDSETGVCIMQMEAGLDTGPVWLRRTTPIGALDTAASLTERLSGLGAVAIVEALAQRERLQPVAQPREGVTYAAKISRAEAPLDWSQAAESLDRQIRAFDPFPGAEAVCFGERIKVWRAQPVEASGQPGCVVAEKDGCPVIACGRGGLLLMELQRPGGRRLGAHEFLRGRPLPMGAQLS